MGFERQDHLPKGRPYRCRFRASLGRDAPLPRGAQAKEEIDYLLAERIVEMQESYIITNLAEVDWLPVWEVLDRRSAIAVPLVTGPEMFELTEGAKISRFNRLHGILADVRPAQVDLDEEKLWQWADRIGQLHAVVFILQGWHGPLVSLLERIDHFDCSRTVAVIGPEARAFPDDVDLTWPGTVHCLTPEMILKQQVRQL